MTPEKLTILVLNFTTAARGSKQEKAAPPPTHCKPTIAHFNALSSFSTST